jgi:ABC-type dipeptide/oligopeptide/nickel transport system permease subunit
MSKILFRNFLLHTTGKIAFGMLVFLIFIALFAPFLAPYSPDALAGEPLEEPSIKHPLGTNDIGQDILSELIYGARTSLMVGLSVAILSTCVGFLVGVAAGYFRGIADIILMRLVDVLLTIPKLPLIILFAFFLGSKLINVVSFLVFLSWPSIARTVRSQTLSLREREYIRYAKFVGASFPYLLRRHFIAELFPLLVAKMVMLVSYAISAEAGLSFLGLGDPTAKSWGMMLNHAQRYPALFWSNAWAYWLLPAGLAITFTILTFTLLGFTAEEALNVRKNR